MNKLNFYSVIIGTELLNGRRKDAHFAFLNQELLKRNLEHKASFVIEDDPKLMQEIFTLIKNDKNSIMFCFGGIGSTPDDYTREVAAKAFTNGKMKFNKKAKQNIIKQFQDEAYPHRINMAYLPKGSKLLKNVVNNVSGFYIKNRFFFTPGFPSMSQAMVIEALKILDIKAESKYRRAITIYTSENDLIHIMQKVPKSLDFSSLPKILDEKRVVVISLSGYKQKKVEKYFKLFVDFCIEKELEYILEDIFSK